MFAYYTFARLITNHELSSTLYIHKYVLHIMHTLLSIGYGNYAGIILGILIADAILELFLAE